MHLVDAVRQALDLADQLRQTLGRERASQLGQTQAQQVDDSHLTDERLGRRHADLKAGAREQHAVGVARGLRAHHVGDRKHGGPASRAKRIAASVSAVSPDWEIPITRSPGPTTGLR